MPLTPNTWFKKCDDCKKFVAIRIHQVLDWYDDPRCPECKKKGNDDA